MLTAKEAKAFVGETVEEKVAKLLVAIEERAKNEKLSQSDRLSIKTSWQYKHDDSLWVSGGYGQTAEWKAAKKILEGLGYTVKFYYYDGSMAVDMYTVVSWG